MRLTYLTFMVKWAWYFIPILETADFRGGVCELKSNQQISRGVIKRALTYLKYLRTELARVDCLQGKLVGTLCNCIWRKNKKKQKNVQCAATD